MGKLDYEQIVMSTVWNIVLYAAETGKPTKARQKLVEDTAKDAKN